ncbi:MAG: hypothetical protein WCR46_17220 [Deltaproteobacteria bacterium]|jgi:hypothetical protein
MLTQLPFYDNKIFNKRVLKYFSVIFLPVAFFILGCTLITNHIFELNRLEVIKAREAVHLDLQAELIRKEFFEVMGDLFAAYRLCILQAQRERKQYFGIKHFFRRRYRE